MTAPERIARELVQYGVRVAFGVPGGEGSSELIQALRRNGIEFVLCHSESHAAFAASANTELTGLVGVVITSLGPGAANAVNGAAHALLDRVPLLIITDRFGQEDGPVSGHQFLGQEALYAPVTKASRRLRRTDLAATLHEAIDTALEHPRGPVHLDFPADLATGEIGEEARSSPPAATALGTSSAQNATTADAAWTELLTALRSAERPLVLCGLEAIKAVDRAALAQLLKHLRAPALTTYKAIGVTTDAPEWNAGVFTGGALEETFLNEADLILTIGFDAVEMIPAEWRWSAPVLRLTESPTACPVTKPAVEVQGPLSRLVTALADALVGTAHASLWTEAEVQGLMEKDHARVIASWSEGGINPTVAVQQLVGSFPTANFSVDAGAHMFAATLALSYMGAHRCSISNGLATMGYGLPAAIGVALAEPDRPAIAITGDGGLSMCLAEMETAVRSAHRLVVFLLNDSQLSLIKIKQEAKGYEPHGTSYGRIDWPAIASAYGARPYQADSEEELAAALEEAAEHTYGVDFIEVRLAPDGYAGLIETVRGRKGHHAPAAGPQ